MKLPLLDESNFALFIIATLIHFASTISTNVNEEKLPRTKRSEEISGDDAGVSESRSHFATIALPPTHRHRYDRQPQPSDRSWRYMQGPRYAPHSEGHKTPRRYNAPPPNYRVSPYPSHPEEHIAYSQVPQREEANREFNDHYLREYPHSHQQQRLQEHQAIQRPPPAIFTPHPEVQDFLSFRDPPTNIRTPDEGQSLRHYNVGFQLSTEAFPAYNRHEKFHESKEQDNSGFRTSNEKHNESKTFLPYYEDYANHDYYGNEEYVEVPTDNTSIHSNHGVLVDAKDHDSSSIFYNNERKEQEVKEIPTTESQGNRPKNLASLLAGMVNLRNIDVTERNWGSSSSTEHLSSTSTTIPANPESSQTNENDYYYYGELYDEFADLYLNNEKESGSGEDSTSKTDESSTEGKNENWRETSSTSLSSSTKAEESVTTQPTLRETTSSPLGSTLAKKLTTLLKSTLSAAAATERPSTSNPPISLSEIIQELGMNLPQFLGTLKTHGTSLKDFTAKLQSKSLSKSEFRRAKGNVKRLLEILESIPDKEGSNNHSNVKEILSTTTKVIPTVPGTRKSSTSEVSPSTTTTTTTEKAKISPKSSRPLIFGSGSGAIPFLKTKTNSQEASKNISKANIEVSDDTTLKPPLSIDFDIPHILNEKGISPADILQDFGKMFNISETSTLPPQLDKKTTVSLRPYQKGAERNRPYRPYDFDNIDLQRGNPNIHRGVINSRLSSTARPTLRPPYSPKPPSINYGNTEEEEEEEEEVNVQTIYNQEEILNKNKENDDKSRSNRKKKYDQYNYNVGKTGPENLDVSTKSAIMAAGILGGVALTVFIAIFIVVKYRNHMHRNRRRIPLTLPSDSSSSSLPPIYASRNVFGKEAYETSGFWTTLKKRFDPYSTSSSPTSM